MSTLILIRHGQSTWNAENRFTGWVNVPLTPQGEAEATAAGERLAAEGLTIDVAYTSELQRAINTGQRVLAAMGQPDLEQIRSWELNERFYGALTGRNKQQTREEFGEEQVQIWRRSYDIPPPNGEALSDTAARTLPFFRRAILGDVADGRDVLVFAHGNSNRSIVMELDDLSTEEVPGLELATGVPVVYDLDEDGHVRSKEVWD